MIVQEAHDSARGTGPQKKKQNETQKRERRNVIQTEPSSLVGLKYI